MVCFFRFPKARIKQLKFVYKSKLSIKKRIWLNSKCGMWLILNEIQLLSLSKKNETKDTSKWAKVFGSFNRHTRTDSNAASLLGCSTVSRIPGETQTAAASVHCLPFLNQKSKDSIWDGWRILKNKNITQVTG